MRIVLLLVITASLVVQGAPPGDIVYLSPIDPRVVGGQDARPGEIKYIVSLRRTSTNSHFCGGSIINNDWILTAAHCVVGSAASTITVVTSTTTLNNGGIRHAVTRVITHPNYVAADSWRNDVALLRLATPIVFNQDLQPIALALPHTSVPQGTPVRASGWGRTAANAPLPNNLQTVLLEAVSNTYCQSLHGNNIYNVHICAYAGVGRGVCNGDSGGPLVVNNTQVGIVSWGRPCALGVPDVYARVSEFFDWIYQNVVN